MSHSDSKVLYQKLGNTWYAFTEVNDELVFTPIPEGIDPRDMKVELYEDLELVSEAA